jgi:DNA (cytosine-5)-methyltransferase 1
MTDLNIVSLFCGAGGLDLGFKKAGFKVIFANEYDKSIWSTFENNFKNTHLDKRDIRKIPIEDIPNCIGIIGGPPCQSWSEAGSLRGINDSRGQLFFDYIKIIEQKKPLFFVAENVSGMLHLRHKTAFEKIINDFKKIGYNVSYKLVNAKNFNVPQDRERVFIIGFLNNIFFEFPQKTFPSPTLKETIFDLQNSAKIFDPANKDSLNNEYYNANYSSIFMSRNRVREWDEQSFTIQAGGRHAPIHPQAPKMEYVEANVRIFKQGFEHLYRRLTVRECARIQTFPDDFIFSYNNILDGYKMVGNAVPVNLAYAIANKIKTYIS